MTTLRKIDFLGLGDFVEVGTNYLRLSADVPDAVLGSVCHKIVAIEGSLPWIIGDFLVCVGQLRGDKRAEELLSHWEVGEGRAYAARRVCAAIPADERRANLSFAHHEVALAETDSLEDAFEWLGVASSSKPLPSSSALRAMIRRSRQSGTMPIVEDSRARYQPCYQFLRFAQATPIAELSREDREVLRIDLQPLHQWLDQL